MAGPNLTRCSPALLVIDSQVEFVRTGADGPIAAEDSTSALASIALLLEAARRARVPVVFTQEAHREELVDFGRELDGVEGIHCVEGTTGVRFRAETAPRKGDFIVQKRRYSAFFATDMDILLRGLGVDTLLICGFDTDCCVHYTAVDGHQHDYHVFIAEDATRGSSLEARRASLAAIASLQDGAVTTTADLVASLQGRDVH
jgi:biuret amidohydrolase